MNKQEFWNELINRFAEHMKERGYSERYVETQRRNLRRLLREFGDLSDIDEKKIWGKYMCYSKGYRTMLVCALKSFKKWCKGEF